MKATIVSALILLLLNINQSFAATAQRTSAEEKIKRQASKALDNQKTVTVKLKSGVVLKGSMQEVSTNDFKLERSETGMVQTILYSDVVSIRTPSQFLNALKNIGKFAFGGTGLSIGGAMTLIGVAAFFGVMILIVASLD